MWTAAIIKVEISADRASRLADGFVGSQIDLLVFDAAPQPFDEHIVPPSPFAVHADGDAVTGEHAGNGIAISMDGKGAWRDNVFVERLWRSVKYEEVYLRAYETVGEARSSIGRYLDFYNGRRPHSSLDGATPDQAYFNSLPLRLAA